MRAPRAPAAALRAGLESGAVVLLASRRPAGPAADVEPECGCDHGRTAHRHYRRGTDCSMCRCGRFHQPLTRRLLDLGRTLRPAA